MLISPELSIKQRQFNAAMELYNSRKGYKIFGLAISITNVSLQIYLLCLILPYSIGFGLQLLTIIAAYLVTDFVNGLVHIYMDNNDSYDSIAGPLIANFHLHHKLPQYKKRSLPVVYFMESGSKVWLAGYLGVVLFIQLAYTQAPLVACFLVYVGILSSIAEVSHYLCHTSTAKTAAVLANCGLLLSKKHHAPHHLQDNCNYAFLNGFTDPLLNRIAAAFRLGYKGRSDLHFAHYAVVDAESR